MELEIEETDSDEDEIIEIEEEEEDDEIFNFAVVEDKPIYPGCENVSKDERYMCFQQGIIDIFVATLDILRFLKKWVSQKKYLSNL